MARWIETMTGEYVNLDRVTRIVFCVVAEDGEVRPTEDADEAQAVKLHSQLEDRDEYVLFGDEPVQQLRHYIYGEVAREAAKR